MLMTQSLQTIESSIYFLERNDRWATEKPYLLDYVPAPPALKSNAVTESCSVVIDDIRGREHEFTFEKNGFCVLPLASQMAAPEDYDDEEKIRDLYLREVGDAVRQALGASRVQIYDFTVRKREKDFPLSNGGYYEFKQPASVAHIDTTPKCMTSMMLAMNSPSVAEQLGKQRYQSVNVWRPLRGPLRDWPLALCAPITLNANDLQPRDTIKRDSFIETFQVHHAASQQWFYISDQVPEEAWMFLQADSSPNGMLGVPHAAFFNSSAGESVVLRESIEVRCMVYYDE